MITVEWSPRKWEACQVQLTCNDAREYRERMGEMQSNVGSMTIDGGTTWIQIMHGAGGRRQQRPGGAGRRRQRRQHDLRRPHGWYWHAMPRQRRPESRRHEHPFTLATCPRRPRLIKACILGAYTKLADQEMKVMLARDAEMARQETQMANWRTRRAPAGSSAVRRAI